MDAAEAVGQLKAAQQLGDTLAQSARQQGAHGLHSHEPGQAWAQHTESMDPSAQGRYAGPVGGQDARQARAGSRELGDPVERFAKPLLHLDTPTSAAWVTPASIHLFSGQDHSVSAQGDVHLTAAHTVSSVSGQTTSLYTHAGGIQAITANAALSVRAHTDAQQVWSEQDLTVQSTTDEVRIQASKSITLTAGQSQIVIEGGNITFTCPGTWTVKGATHDWLGGGSQPARLAGLPDSRARLFNRQFQLVNETTGEPIPGMPYCAVDGDGDRHYGTTDESGLTMLIGTLSPQDITVEWGVLPSQPLEV
jgi:type VI secretion system secreted protein VgrG